MAQTPIRASFSPTLFVGEKVPKADEGAFAAAQHAIQGTSSGEAQPNGLKGASPWVLDAFWHRPLPRLRLLLPRWRNAGEKDARYSVCVIASSLATAVGNSG